ncbi:MAG: hypothetical protein WC183_06135, partial [Methanosarcina sp.]
PETGLGRRSKYFPLISSCLLTLVIASASPGLTGLISKLTDFTSGIRVSFQETLNIAANY